MAFKLFSILRNDKLWKQLDICTSIFFALAICQKFGAALANGIPFYLHLYRAPQPERLPSRSGFVFTNIWDFLTAMFTGFPKLSGEAREFPHMPYLPGLS
jgi:hypothetical protein